MLLILRLGRMRVQNEILEFTEPTLLTLLKQN